MSTVIVKVVEIGEVIPHINADRLDVTTVEGFPCICGRDQFKPGDKAIYFPIDIVLPVDLEAKLFANSKIKPSGGRIRATKIRGVFSEGLLVKCEDLLPDAKVGQDVTALLRCKKFEPPEEIIPVRVSKMKATKRRALPRYTDTQRGEKLFDSVFKDDELLVGTVKLHGTSARYGWVEVEGTTWYMRLWLWFLRSVCHREVKRFVVGTRNVDRTIDENTVYAKAAIRHDLPRKLVAGQVLFGEIVGHGIQNGFNYGCKPGEFKFFAYCLTEGGFPVPYKKFCDWCADNDLTPVPLCFLSYKRNFKDKLPTLFTNRVEGLEDDIPCREGVVVAPLTERVDAQCGMRTVVKFINPEYLLLKNPGDNH